MKIHIICSYRIMDEPIIFKGSPCLLEFFDGRAPVSIGILNLLSFFCLPCPACSDDGGVHEDGKVEKLGLDNIC